MNIKTLLLLGVGGFLAWKLLAKKAQAAPVTEAEALTGTDRQWHDN